MFTFELNYSFVHPTTHEEGLLYFLDIEQFCFN